MKILIVDDEPLALANLEQMISALPGTSIVGTARSGLSALHACETRDPDLVLVDVEMPGMNGVAFAQEVQTRRNVQIIFVTAYDQYATDAFDLEATDYVLKPVDPARLKAAIERARQRLLVSPVVNAVKAAALQLAPAEAPPPAELESAVYWANTDGGMVRIPLADITRVEACKDYAYIHTSGRKFMVRETMTRLQEAFDGTSLRRTHRSHIVNLTQVQAISQSSGKRAVTLINGDQVPVGRSFHDDIENALTGS